VPESRRAFTAELQTEGFAVSADGLVYGMMLAEDAKAYPLSQSTPAASKMPERTTTAKRRKAEGEKR
jgi:hypothetical protein